MQRASWLCVVLISVACTQPPTGTSSSSSGSVDAYVPWTIRDFVREYQLASCALEERCRDVRGARFSSRAACEQAIDDADWEAEATSGVGTFEFFANNYNLLDEARARTCVAHLSTVECGAPALDAPECEQARGITAPATTGELCNGPRSAPHLCDESSLYCGAQPGNAACTVCQELHPEGAGCSTSSSCETGFCSVENTCTAPAPRARGETCTRDDQCAGELLCTAASDGGTRTCAARGGAGDSCAVTPCQVDLACIDGTCAARLDDGATCDRNSTGAGCRHLCVFPSADAAQGTCGLPSDLPVVDEPCVRARESLPNVCKPLETIYPDYTVQFVDNRQVLVACTCRHTGGAGDACFHNGACGGGRCVGVTRMGDALSAGTCQPKLIDGQRCQRSSDCLSGVCDPGGMMPTCVPAPGCP